MVARNEALAQDPAPDPVEPPDRGGRGAGADHDPHRLHHHGARGRRPVGRRLRPAGPHAGPGRHRHAGPRQLHDGERRPLPGEVPRRHDAAGRPLHHQRPLARHRPPARPHRRHAGLPQRAASSASSPTPRMSSTSAGSAWGRRGGASSRKGSTSRSSSASTAARRTRPSSTSSAPASRTPVELEGDVYSLCACNDAGAKRLVEMMDEFAMDSLDPLAELHLRQLAARDARRRSRKLPRGTYRGADPLGRLRGAGDAEGRDDHRRRTASWWTTPAPPACRRAASTCPPAYCRAYSCFGIKCVVAPEIPNNWASPRALPHGDPGGLHPERAAALSRQRAPRRRPAAARPDDGLPAPGGAGPGERRRAPRRCGTRRCAAARRYRARRRRLRRISRSSPSTPAAPARGRRRTGWTAPPSPPACAPCRWRRPRTSRR